MAEYAACGPPIRVSAATRRSSSRRCWTGPWRSASTRCAPATTPGWRTACCAAASTRGRTSPTCWPSSSGTSSRTPSSPSVTPPRTGSAPKPRSAASARSASPTVTTSASSPTVTPRGFLARQLGEAPGPIVDTSGTAIGHHGGAYAFTVGQRRGLHLDRPADDGRPRYVLSIEPVISAVTVWPAPQVQPRNMMRRGPVSGSRARSRSSVSWSRVPGHWPPGTTRTRRCQLSIRSAAGPAEGALDRRDRAPRLLRRNRYRGGWQVLRAGRGARSALAAGTSVVPGGLALPPLAIASIWLAPGLT